MKKYYSLAALLLLLVSCTTRAQTMPILPQDSWQPNLASLSQHSPPEWLMDAKIGVQFVGPRLSMDDDEAYHWMLSAQRMRKLGATASSPDLRTHVEEFKTVVGRNREHKIPYAFVHDAPTDLDAMIADYRRTGAKFLVSQVQGAYPGTEGLYMSRDEIAAARQAGFRIGLHNNLLSRETLPSAGDPGYVDWYRARLQIAVEDHSADFIFFDGAMASPEYFRTFDTVAWYYNWAERSGKQVWVNDDFGRPLNEKQGHSDVIDHEGFTMNGVADHAWVNWDTLRNEWTCWINEFGNHRRSGARWQWQYREAEDLLQMFIYNVSIGGVWIVQMDNTAQSWQTMDEIGEWLEINGEAIYNTRPVSAPNSQAHRIPDRQHTPVAPNTEVMPSDGAGHWWWRWQQSLTWAKNKGPTYKTKSKNGEVIYVIHMGWPGDTLTVSDIHPKDNSSIRMLGTDTQLNWSMRGDDLMIQTPPSHAEQYAYSFKIETAE